MDYNSLNNSFNSVGDIFTRGNKQAAANKQASTMGNTIGKLGKSLYNRVNPMAHAPGLTADNTTTAQSSDDDVDSPDSNGVDAMAMGGTVPGAPTTQAPLANVPAAAGGGTFPNRNAPAITPPPPSPPPSQFSSGIPAAAHGGGYMNPLKPSGVHAMAGGGVVDGGFPGYRPPEAESAMRRYSPIGPINPAARFQPSPEDMAHRLPRRLAVTPRLNVRLPRPKIPGGGAVKVG